MKTIKEIAWQYSGLQDVPGAWVQTPSGAIIFTEGRKERDGSLLAASKGVVAVLIAPTLMDIILQRGSADQELDG